MFAKPRSVRECRIARSGGPEGRDPCHVLCNSQHFWAVVFLSRVKSAIIETERERTRERGEGRDARGSGERR